MTLQAAIHREEEDQERLEGEDDVVERGARRNMRFNQILDRPHDDQVSTAIIHDCTMYTCMYVVTGHRAIVWPVTFFQPCKVIN